MTHKARGLTKAATMIGLSAWQSMCWAQGDAGRAETKQMLEEVVVTAQRREQNLQMTPVAVTAISGAELEAKNVMTLLDVGNSIPNVSIGSQSAQGTQNGAFYIRGIGQDRSGIAFDQGVGVYADDVYFSRSDSSLLSVVDVERIEVLRGPQGTLFGKNTIGGAVRYITRKPGPELSGYVDATLGSFDRTDLKASVNVPLSERVYAKATFGSLRNDGFQDEVAGNRKFGNEDTRIARLQLRALPTDRLTVDLSVSSTQIDTNGRAFAVTAIDPNAVFPNALRIKTGESYDERYLTSDPYKIHGGRDVFYRYDGIDANLTLDYELTDALTLKSISGYQSADVHNKSDWDGSPLPIFDSELRRDIDFFSHELQLSGTVLDGRLSWVSGLYYSEESPEDRSITITGFDATFPVPRVETIAQQTTSYAVYAQGTYAVTDKFSTTLGLRYSRDDKQLDVANFIRNLNGSGEDSWDNVSPRLSLEYQWTDMIMSYASVTRGFRSGSINGTLLPRAPGGGPSYVGVTQPLFPYDPEDVWAYEMGLRSDLFDRRVRLNATVFRTEYEDIQLTYFDAPLNLVLIQNVGKAHMEGAELEAQVVATDNLRLQLSAGWLDAQYDELGAGVRGLTLDSDFTRTPELTYSAGARYELPMSRGNRIVFNLDYSWRDDQRSTSSDSNTTIIEAYGLLNGRIQYDSADGNWSVAVYGRNLTDELYYIGGIDFVTIEHSIGALTRDLGRPRELGVSLKYNF